MILDYEHVRRIDTDDVNDEPLPETCDMATPDGGMCDHAPDYVMELYVDGDDKGVVVACDDCFRVPNPDGLPTDFSTTVDFTGDPCT